MSPDISEFSYGYALTETLIGAVSGLLNAAPVFPSLVDEGKPGGGYDVHLPFAGLPVFLQFKLSHKMVRHTAFEVGKTLLSPPFYRMHLRPTKHSQQHPMLLALEARHPHVYYAAPAFHTPSELNDAYIKRVVPHRSVFIKPSEIGHLPDEDDHHISFMAGGGPMYMCSEHPREVAGWQRDGNRLIDELVARVTPGLELGQPDAEVQRVNPSLKRSGISRGESASNTPPSPPARSTSSPESADLLELNDASADAWADRLEQIIREHISETSKNDLAGLTQLHSRRPLLRLVYLARAYFGSDILVVAGSAAQI